MFNNRIVQNTHFGSFAYLAGIVVEPMKTGVVGRPVNSPRGKDKQVAGSTGIETALGRFPVFANRLFLQKNQRQTGVKGIADDKALAS